MLPQALCIQVPKYNSAELADIESGCTDSTEPEICIILNGTSSLLNTWGK